MENGRIMNSSVIQDGFMMKTHDEEEPSKIHNDIITNCLKNREWQHRYRALKRLEADMKDILISSFCDYR
ncbi:hypothetical protein NC653_008734 [Populus alba x Populus x berolinensis]|uniref:Uncharacterized protein n=1 Tax=Populus alba x Populus x berolinensis TaxID=444605 RepID=A0AAD6R7E5_9ROSI|nr:hypothetical protein NC653_008734 [Populus alba x Populus x berolinensis]